MAMMRNKENLQLEFAQMFRHNINTRSRTSKGQSNTGASSAKKVLDKSGALLAEQVAQNTEKLIEAIFCSVHSPRTRTRCKPVDVRRNSEHWYDIINHNLQSEDAYRDERRTLEIEAMRLQDGTKIAHSINPRYRVWNVSYAEYNPPPSKLELWMDAFYAECLKRIAETDGTDKDALARLLAWVNRELDFIIHPWADGCGRHATAIVMWVALFVEATRLPRFTERKALYDTIKDLQEHTQFFRQCLE